MPAPVKITAILAARPGKAGELKALLLGIVAACRAEPGNLGWDIWQDQADPGRFVLDELYTDNATVAAHRETIAGGRGVSCPNRWGAAGGDFDRCRSFYAFRGWVGLNVKEQNGRLADAPKPPTWAGPPRKVLPNRSRPLSRDTAVGLSACHIA